MIADPIIFVVLSLHETIAVLTKRVLRVNIFCEYKPLYILFVKQQALKYAHISLFFQVY